MKTFKIICFFLCLQLIVQITRATTDNSSDKITSGKSSTDGNHANNLKLILNQEEEKVENRRHHHLKRFIILTRSTNSSAGECGSSSDDFPSFFEQDQIEKGGIILVFLIGIYCFTLLALICDQYFLPCVERICLALNLSHDVAAATFMSVATSAPELFVNIIGTFITESDMGIGTVVGSSLFNTLGVASLGGLAASKPVQLHWWPVTRDVIIYILSVLLLIGITWDGMVIWYEGLILFLVYFFYLLFMFQNKRISSFVKSFVRRHSNKVSDCEKGSGGGGITSASSQSTGAAVTPSSGRLSVAVISSYGSYSEETKPKFIDNTTKSMETLANIEKVDDYEEEILFRWPADESCLKKMFFVYTWPLKLLLKCTVPDPQKHPKLFPITFVICVILIGVNSYVVSWMISIIGVTMNIPDAVLGLTFLAAGGCLPEAISITIMTRRGEGSMGVSNSLGANTMNILLSLGMPWFIKTLMVRSRGEPAIIINSGSIEYTICGLVLVALILYFTLYFNKFQLGRKVGLILIITYTICIVLAILAEMVFFDSKCS